MCMGHDDRLTGIENHGYRSSAWLGLGEILIFYCHVISCVLAWRGTQCVMAEASSSGRVQCVWAW